MGGVCASVGWNSQWSLGRYPLYGKTATGMTIPIIVLSVTFNPFQERTHFLQPQWRLGKNALSSAWGFQGLWIDKVFYMDVSIEFCFSICLSIVSTLFSGDLAT